MAPHPWRPPAKRRRRSNDASNRPDQSKKEIPKSAYIQAYEAQLVYGQKQRAEELYTIPDVTSDSLDSTETGAGSRYGGTRGVGGSSSSLIKWAGGDVDGEIWTDRYDILHLLPTLPIPGPSSAPHGKRAPSPASSSSSWDDLPSDEEERFGISDDEEIQEFERKKKAKWMERLREERLRERVKQDDAEEADHLDRRAESKDEQPPDTIRSLMQHTALSLYRSPNPKILEMRIMTHHAQDDRFAFLRGKYNTEWEKVKRKARIELGLEKEASSGSALLGGYGSSGEDDDEDDNEEPYADGETEPPPPMSPPPPPPPPAEEVPTPPEPLSTPPIVDQTIATSSGQDEDAEEAKRRERRARAEEWKRKRREAAERVS